MTLTNWVVSLSGKIDEPPLKKRRISLNLVVSLPKIKKPMRYNQAY